MQAPKPSLTDIVPHGSRSISQSLLNPGQIFTEPIQNKLALFAARHFGTKQLKDERIGRLPNSPHRCVGSFNFQATQTSAIDKCLRIIAYGSTTKLDKSVASQAQND
jgi:hypothetical protein